MESLFIQLKYDVSSYSICGVQGHIYVKFVHGLFSNK